jgi:Zn finger protein HypA/HybF involved in hydrogenase expression
MPEEMTAVCQECHARVTFPMPDGFKTPDGTMIPAAEMDPETVAAYLRGYTQEMPCPTCGQTQLRVISEEGGKAS